MCVPTLRVRVLVLNSVLLYGVSVALLFIDFSHVREKYNVLDKFNDMTT